MNLPALGLPKSPHSLPTSRCCIGLLMLIGILLISACSGPLRLYKISIQQGNVFTPEMLGRIQPGMTKKQVRFVLGSPLIQHTFDQNRWDYIYRLQPPNSKAIEFFLTIYFDRDALSKYDTNIKPLETAEQLSQTLDLEEEQDANPEDQALDSTIEQLPQALDLEEEQDANPEDQALNSNEQ